jgi:c(7)-type cytochrome triheme protein
MKRAGLGFFVLLFFASMVSAKAGGGDISFEVKGSGTVMFSHDSHLSAGKLQCTDCHASLYVTNEKHKKATMKQMQQGKSCGACHNGKKAFDVKGGCNTCHKK